MLESTTDSALRQELKSIHVSLNDISTKINISSFSSVISPNNCPQSLQIAFPVILLFLHYHQFHLLILTNSVINTDNTVKSNRPTNLS